MPTRVFVVCQEKLAGKMVCRMITSNHFTGEYHQWVNEALPRLTVNDLVLVIGDGLLVEDRERITAEAARGWYQVRFLTEEEILSKQMVSLDLIDFLRGSEGSQG